MSDCTEGLAEAVIGELSERFEAMCDDLILSDFPVEVDELPKAREYVERFFSHAKQHFIEYIDMYSADNFNSGHPDLVAAVDEENEEGPEEDV